MLKKSIHLSQIVLFSLVLLACGNAGTGGGESNGAVDNNPDVGDGSGSGDLNTAAETIGVRIETNTEDGFIERNDIATGNISIVALDHEFKEGHPSALPSSSTKNPDDDGYQLEFNELYIEQSNLVIKAVVGKDSDGKNIVLYAPLYSLPLNTSISVNIFSHYVLKKLFDTLETDEDLDELIPCDANNCPNQVLAKANLLAKISQAAQEYEITIPNNLSIAESLIFLDEQVDFRTHIETAVAEISRSVSPIAKGTRRAFGLESIVRLQYDTEYNGLWFALSLNNLNPENTNNEIVVATETTTIIENDPDIGNSSPIYPSYNQFSTFLDARKELLSSKLPFTRASLAISQNLNQNNNYSYDPSSPNNFLASLTPNDTSASTEGSLLNVRALSQQVPKEDGIENVGWQFNPFFSKLYKANEYERDSNVSLPIDFEDLPNTSVSPTWLLGANYSTGGSFSVTKNSNDKFDRGDQIENLNIFSWEVHGQETDATFSIDQINGKNYGVINYSLNLEDGTSTDNVLELFAETEQWTINGGTINFDQPSTHFRSYTRSRDKDNIHTSQNDLDTISAELPRGIFTIETEEGTAPYDNKGLISFDGASSPRGHSTQDGKHLAFVYEAGLGKGNQDRGRGITIATELSGTLPIFPDLSEDEGARYTLLGNTFGINEKANTLRNVNNSILILSDRIENEVSGNTDCNASLEGVSVFIEHTAGVEVGQNTLSEPLIESTESIPSVSCTLTGNRIEINFDAITGADTDTMFAQALTLKGFISPHDEALVPGNVISLLWIQDDNLGLVFATKDQQLSPTFD